MLPTVWTDLVSCESFASDRCVRGSRKDAHFLCDRRWVLDKHDEMIFSNGRIELFHFRPSFLTCNGGQGAQTQLAQPQPMRAGIPAPRSGRAIRLSLAPVPIAN